MFSWYKYLIVNLVFAHLGFWSGDLILIAPFPDLCLLVPFHAKFPNHRSSGPAEDFYRFLLFIAMAAFLVM